MPNSLKFGTSGLRGLAVDLVGAESRRYAAAFVRHLQTRGRVSEVLVGRDLRASSPEIAQSVIDAIVTAGALAVDCGALPGSAYKCTRCQPPVKLRSSFPRRFSGHLQTALH